jgi:Glyoxalase-like domain
MTGTQPLPGDIDHIDHSVLMTRDIDATAATYEALGFTLSPLSRHQGSATPGGPREPMGAGNRCAYFGRTYLELLGVFFDGSRDPWNVRPLVEAHAGLRGVVLGAGDCEVARARLADAGVPVSDVLPLQRDIDTPDGVATARFRSVHIARDATPEGEILIGQQLTPELVHQQRYLAHRNGATGLAAMLLVVADDELDAHLARWSRLLGRDPQRHGDRHSIQLDDGRIDLAPLAALEGLLPGESAPLLPYLASQTFRVADLDVTRRLVEAAGFTTGDLGVDPADGTPGFFVPASEAAGAAVAFTGPEA